MSNEEKRFGTFGYLKLAWHELYSFFFNYLPKIVKTQILIVFSTFSWLFVMDYLIYTSFNVEYRLPSGH